MRRTLTTAAAVPPSQALGRALYRACVFYPWSEMLAVSSLYSRGNHSLGSLGDVPKFTWVAERGLELSSSLLLCLSSQQGVLRQEWPSTSFTPAKSGRRNPASLAENRAAKSSLPFPSTPAVL